jgi:hypothetical protein
MAIDDATKKKITKLFCEAITSYNEVVELRKSDKEALVEEFNSNLQFYSSIECAFRSVIEQIIGKSCPHNLHEMIEMMVEELTPNPLERGIDLFYILRYKDTRNQTVHNINICEVNAYPKLFLNGYRFIKEYVDKDIEVEPWKEECEEFDYALFNQIFRQSMYDNIRILVLPPLYDSKEKLEILTRYHWNVILDFDPYSGVCGSFSKLNVKNKKLVQLSQIEKYSSTQFSVEDVTWIMCDGDKLLNIKSFKPLKKQNVTKGLFIPSMLDGQDNWSSCYNSSETMLSTKKLLNLFFEKYFEKIQYNVQLFFVMDYAARVNEVVYDAVSDNLNKFMYKLNVHLLNESLSEQLFLDANNFEEWNIYNSTFDSFLCKVEKNTINDDEEEHIYLLPCIFPSDGKLSEKAYNHISQDFYVLHKGFPCAQDDINKDHTVQQDAQNFLRGEEASWRLIKSRMIPKLDVGKSVERQIKRAIDAGRKYFNLYHAAGFGGSTIAKQIAYCLSAEYPVLFMKKYVKEELGSRIAQIYNIAHKRIVVFVEEELFDNVGVQKNECLKLADATSAQVTFVFIARRPQMYDRMSAKEGFFICRYASDDVERIIEFNKNLLADNNKKILSYDGQTFIRKLGEDNLCPFLINLSIYKDEFIKIEEYIRPYVNEINVRPDLKKVFVYVCIFTIFINKGIPIAFFCKKLSVDEEKEWSVIRDKYDPIIYKRYNIEFYISEVMIRAPYMAERLLRSLIGDGEEGILYRKQLSEYLVDLIVDLKLFYTNNGYSEKCLRQLFIDKETNEYVEDEFSDVIVDKDLTIIKKYFAPVIAKLWDKDDINLAGDIFEALINNYPKDSYFYAHAARYYAYTGRDYTKAETYYNRAIKLLDEKDNLQSSQADIYHVKGMCIREELFKNLEGLPEDRDLLSTIDKEPLKELYYRAESAFETTYHIALSTDSKTIEYAYTAWLTLIVRTLTNNRIKLLNDLEIEEEIEKGLTIISSLEDIYYLEENANESDIQRQLVDIQRKKETLLSLQKEFKEAVSHWNNYYDIHKNGGNYSNCLYSCKQRYYLLEKETQDFKKITEQNRKRMEKLADDYYEAILHVNYEELKLGDLNIFLSVSIVTNYKVDKVMSKLSGFYQQERKNHILLYYRYVLKFIKAYEGDKLALQECISYMRECCEFSERKPGKANIIDYFAVGEQMGQILSKKRLFRMNTMYRTQAYTAKELRFIYGVLKQQGSETTIIPYDTNGVLMTGIEIHANLKYNPDVEASDSGQMVKLRFGFSYDGLKAENMSIRYADENEEKNEIIQERLKVGDYTEFCYKHILTSSKTGKPYGIVGYVDANENCILRIGEITNRRINQEEFAKVIELCQKKNIKVQLIDHTEKGWVASLKSQKLDFENINS